MPLRSDHAAEGVGQRGADHEDQGDFEQVGERVRILERVRRVGVEEAAAVAAHQLDRLLRGDGTRRDDLVRAFERSRRRSGGERLGHAERNQREPADHRERQEHVEQRPGLIDPEVADRRGAAAREATDQGDGDRDAGGGGEEGEDGDAGHLRQIADAGFRAVRTASWCW